MRAVAQRVSAASVVVEGETVGEIGRGLLVYLGAARGDGPTDVIAVARKLAGLRVFPDEAGKMSCSVEEIGGELLVVSQFTLLGDARKGRRPSFTAAAAPDEARSLYEGVISELRKAGLRVATGRFRTAMEVRSKVDGPVTILIDSKKVF